MSLPVPRSLQEIFKKLLQTYLTKSGVTDIAKGSANRSLLEAAALSDFKIQGDIMSALASVDIDRASGPDLDRVGFEESVSRSQARESNGVITISQKSLVKIATKIYQGTAAVPAGSITINIADGTSLPSTGSIYIGRGTNNLEGPIAYTGIASLGSYYQLTLATVTTKNHNTGESVILAQSGNRFIPAGSLVQTRSTLTSQSVTFRIINSVTLLDGEVEIREVPVICTQVGSIGNISSNAIVEFASAPFPNAVASNPLAFVSGRDVMSDIEYRELIKKTNQSRVKGTDLAIIQASVGVQSGDDNKTVTSAEIRKPSSRTEPSILFIDDSTGYQPIFSGQGFEQIIDNANGGEKYLQLQKEDLVKASIVTSLEAPFAVTGGMKLSVIVGSELSEHLFLTSDFSTEGAVDTFEIVNSINNNPALTFNARSFNNSKKIVLFSKSFNNEDIQITTPSSGVNANDFLGFGQTITYTLRLYKNDALLYKDGIIPTIYSNQQNTWNNSITDGATLKIKVDQSGVQSITINNADFVPYGYALVNKDNSLESWASILNTKLAGITVTVEDSRLKMVSNRGANSAARLEVSSDLSSNSLSIGDNMWEPGVSQGLTSDYALNQSTGQIELATPATASDVFTAGSKYTKGFIDSGTFSSGSLTLSGSGIAGNPDPKLYFIVDAPASRRSVSLSNIMTVSITNPSANVWRYTFSVAGVLAGLLKDDLVIITENTLMALNNTGISRINAVDAGNTWFEVVKTTGTVQGPITLTSANDFIFINSPDGELQEAQFPTGLQTLTAISNIIKTLSGLTSEVIGGKKIRVSTLSYDKTFGSIYLAGQNLNGGAIGFTIGSYDSSEISHTAFNDSQDDNTFIEFFHDSIATGDSSNPFTSVTTTTDLDAAGYHQNYKMSMLNPIGQNISSNRGQSVDIEAISGVNVTLRNSAKLKEIIANDRYYLSVPFNFSALDNLVVVLDSDTLNKTFNISLSRKSKVYLSPNASTLRAYDADFGPTANFPSGFGNNFNFADFKIHMKSRVVIDPINALNKMMIRSASFGPSGDQIRVGIFYPQSETSGITHSITSGITTDIRLFLASGALRTGGAWDATTEFDITEPISDTWRYTYNGTGTAPSFLSAAITIGDIVNISSGTMSSNNKGVFRVSAVTNTYFEVTNNAGGTVESNKTISTPSSLKFYDLNDAANTAALLEAYVTASVSDYISISQLEAGSGIIEFSTFDESIGVKEFDQLVDGENYIDSSNIGTKISPTNEFSLKSPLNIFGADLLNEEFYLIPTRSEHLNRYLNIFAVTGISSLGNISLSNGAKSIQFYSNLFGSSGTVYVTGGAGNKVSGAIIESGAIINDNYLKFSIPKAASVGFNKGQWIEVSNTELSAKDTKLKSTSQLDWDSVTSVGISTITIANSTVANLYNNGYFWTKRYHDVDATTEMRVEKHGKFTALIWTGVGTEPKFKKTLTITNIERTSSVSTVTFSTNHGIAANKSAEIVISGAVDSSFNGTFRATYASANSVSFTQALSNVISTVSTGSGVMQVRKTDRIILGSGFNPSNRGEFSVVGTFGNNTLYIENTDMVAEDVTLTGNSDIVIYDYDSVRPGDTFSVGSSVLDSSLPYESHMGEFIVSSLNSNENEILITSSTFQDVAGVTLGANFNTVRVIEQSSFLMYAKIFNITQSPGNINNYDVIVEGTELASKITPSLGTSISTVSKLGFSTDINSGEDSYKYYGGLISAVGQKIRGKASDPITFPGVAAAGSFIIPDAALPKRIQLSIVIRNRTGTPFSIVKSRVQSSVAAYVNSVGVGKPVIFSEIVVASQVVDGVQAVSISSPVYNSSNDMIVSQPDQKPLVFNIDIDIVVSQAT